MNKSLISTVFTATMIGLLSGCGGGGGDEGSTTTTTNFPLQVGYKARIAAGSTDNFTVSGTCSGSATFTNGPATAASFQSVPGFSVAQTATVMLTNCTPATNAVTGTAYYDANYSPLGSQILGVEFTKFVTLPPAIPASVKVGDTAHFATFDIYANSTMVTKTGQRVISYVIEADGANTAIANLITKSYNNAGQLLFTQQSRYRISADGTLAMISIDMQYSTTSTTHLLYTKS